MVFLEEELVTQVLLMLRLLCHLLLLQIFCGCCLLLHLLLVRIEGSSRLGLESEGISYGIGKIGRKGIVRLVDRDTRGMSRARKEY